jgi:hypothetical protein
MQLHLLFCPFSRCYCRHIKEKIDIQTPIDAVSAGKFAFVISVIRLFHFEQSILYYRVCTIFLLSLNTGSPAVNVYSERAS